MKKRRGGFDGVCALLMLRIGVDVCGVIRCQVNGYWILSCLTR